MYKYVFLSFKIMIVFILVMLKRQYFNNTEIKTYLHVKKPNVLHQECCTIKVSTKNPQK